MDETVLVRADLSAEMVAAGRALLIGLDARNLSFGAAFWLLDEASGAWHLTLAGRSVRKNGSLALYNKVNRILLGLGLQDKVWIGMISIVDQRSRIVQSLRGALGTATSIDGARLDNATISGVHIPACLVYRVSARQKLRSQTGDMMGSDKKRSASKHAHPGL